MNHPVTFLCVVYNEEARIGRVLEHATAWADHVLIVDKGSTDRTLEVCRRYPQVEVKSVPYSPGGMEDTRSIVSSAPSDWVFVGTCSEVPTKGLIVELRAVLDAQGDTLDLIEVPRRMYSMGVHDERSYWSVANYPFCINKTRAVIENRIHHNFSAAEPGRVHRIPYSEQCCVYHLTHPSMRKYFGSMAQYFEAEAEQCDDPDAAIEECFRIIAEWQPRLREAGPELFGQYCYFPMYWLGKAAFIWEKYRAVDVEAYYAQLSDHLVRSQWKGDNAGAMGMPQLQSQWFFSGTVKFEEKTEDPKSFRSWVNFIRRFLGTLKNRLKKRIR